MGGRWQIRQNEDGLPRLRVSPYYRGVLQDGGSTREEKKFIKERLEAAEFLIKSIYQRQSTIQKVMNVILERQEGFFDRGPEQLRPMILRNVAEEIGVHESTVSRATSNKYVLTPHGIFELKYFFDAAIQRTHGEDLAGEAVREKLRKLIQEEDRKNPLSDEALVQLLTKQNVKIARRTVAKYRDQMGILPSSQRKQMF
jgi:RNA polymerase sigma-54 factor